ncbi:biotin carboxyl carrier protein [Kineosphaera limosa]|uniref:Biotin carboxyl carrier protein of acetyl-CoA carboxylase n=1 Tax=Kineosphaera limosa NBRC 100340 TaxID=1184609 RepID=K6W740_9MICO|nr:acetyl-CoA carboxylase [Kineosphaera limosa]NYE00524.1 biotin carboxyl carrier protein [Kineosphaera limosa]GAB95010.1 acetyl-CoA carboxylase biotin carboxyl carrier protein [Kineosphaera limosa NBRC 100340]
MAEQQIVSPLPGIFYRSPSPDEPPFVEDGGSIEAGATVGLVEVMKQFTEIKAEAAGSDIRFEVDDEGMVNPGDVIAVVQG